ncbi:MAG: hypothetical protein EOO38_00085 [Cytophagaceae bacterium]|nr:MAG: hypothetical protein EOO38_00085 [Cytophagaceae bacterium]
MQGVAHYLFRRIYQVALQGPDALMGIQFGNVRNDETAIRIAFSLEKKADSSPNKGTISLYNLNPKTRAAISLGWRISLRVGYEGLNETIFVGKIGIINHTRAGPDIVTECQVMEAYGALIMTPFSKSYPPMTHVAQVLRDIAESMNVDIGVVRDIPDTVYTKGIVLSGSCRDALNTVLKPLKMEASVSNSKLNILPLDRPFGTRAVVIGQDTGMINTPSVEKRNVSFDALLIPQLCVPGQLVQVRTVNQLATGFFKIRAVKIEGDTHDQRWNVSCNCARLEGVQEAPNVAQGLDFNAAIKGLL